MSSYDYWTITTRYDDGDSFTEHYATEGEARKAWDELEPSWDITASVQMEHVDENAGTITVKGHRSY